jgi:hypothetical protein
MSQPCGPRHFVTGIALPFFTTIYFLEISEHGSLALFADP